MRENRRTFLALAALLAIFGIFFRPSPLSPPPNESTNTKESAADGKDDKDEMASGDNAFLQPLLDFMGPGEWATIRFNPKTPNERVWKPLLCKVQKDYEFRCVIVSVPDPLLSPFGSWFDLMLNSIQQAVETHRNGVLDRMWLPWRLKGKKAAAPGNRPFERQPGSMLFRLPRRKETSSDSQKAMASKPELLFVLLVGETPTAGIHKQAMATALNFLNDVAPVKGQKKEFKLLSPLFSGSETSLRQGLISWAGPGTKTAKRPPLKMISGTATSIDKRYLQDSLADYFQSVEFHATVIPDILVFKELLKHIRDKDPSASIALLSEGNTTYARKAKPDADILDLQFPLYVSRLRTAEARAGSDKNQGGTSLTTGSVTHFTGEKDDKSREWEAIMQPERTVVDVEQLLSRILQTISQEGVRYVGILATDELDKLFLAQQVRKFCPDVQLFTTVGSQILFHPDYALDTRGMLVGSTYPLWGRSGSRSGDTKTRTTRRVFSNQHTQGIFNAAVILLDEKEAGDGSLSQKVIDYTAEVREKVQGRPPIWISVVGRNGLWPVTTRVPGATDKAEAVGEYAAYVQEVPPGKPVAQPPVPFSWLWLSVVVVMTIIGGIVCFAGWRDALSRSEEPPELARWGFLGLAWGVMAVFALAVGFLSWPTTPADPGYYWISGFAVLAGTVLTVLATIVFMQLPSSRAETRMRWYIPSVLFIVFLGFWLLCLLLDREGRVYQFHRILHLESGLSVLLPLFFLALSVCCCWLSVLKGIDLRRRFTVSRFLASDDKNGPLAFLQGKLTRLQPVEESAEKINEFLDTYVVLWKEGRWLRVVLLVVLFFTLGRLANQAVPSFESNWGFDQAVRLGFATASIMILYGLFRLHILWGLIKDLLERLATLPIVSAYSRMPAKISALFGRHMSPQRPHRSHMVLPLHQWGLIVAAFNDLEKTGSVRKAVGDDDLVFAFRVQARAFQLLPQLHELPEEMEYEKSEVFRHLQDAAGLSLRILEKFWQRIPARDAYALEPDSKDDKKSEGQADEYPIRSLRKSDEVSPEVKQWLRMLEDFVAMQSVPFLCQFFAPLRNLTHNIILSLILLLLVVTSYPFQPQRLLLTFLLTLLVAAIGQIVVIYIQMDRDEVLSRIAGTTPNKVSFDAQFFSSILAYTAPLIAVVLALLGDLGGVMAAWLEPLTRILK